MAIELGSAYLSIGASTDGMAKDIYKELGVVEKDADKTGKKSGSFLGSGLKKGLKVGAVALGGLVAGVGALALTGGISRALNIEDAQAKLKGLGHDTKSIDTIMGNALASVKGTAFGLGDAATVASSAVAAGIKPGQDLERTLTLVGDAAQIAGVGMGDMGAIFNKAAASNKVQMDVINQLHDAGVPALALLADQMGVTAEEASKMASAGQIDFATFQDAMESGMGGAAQAAGGTFRGAMANAKAALGRLGETVAVPVLDALRDAFNKAIPVIDNVTSALKPFVEELSQKISDALPVVVDKLKAALDLVVPVLKDGWQFLVDWKDVLIPLGLAVAAFFLALDGVKAVNNMVTAVKAAKTAMLAFNAALLANPIGLIVAAVAALVAGLVYFFTQTEVGKELWDKIWNGIKATWDAVSGAIMAGFDAFMGYITPIFEAMGAAWSVVWEGLKAVVQSVTDWFSTHVGPLFAAFGELVSAVWDTIKQRLELAWAGIQLIWDLMLAGWELMWGLIMVVWDTVGPPLMAIMETAWNNAKILFETVWNNIKTVFETIWNQIKLVFETVWNIIKAVVETALGVIKGVITTVTGLIKGDWGKVWEGIKQIFGSVWTGIKSVASTAINYVKSTISNVLNGIKGIWENVWNGITSFASTVWEGIKDTFSAGVGTMRDIFTRMGDAISSPFKSAFNGIARAWNNTVGKLSFEVPNWVPAMGGKGWSAPKIPMLAAGGTALAAGWSLIGEEGPELLHMPRGASVVPLGHPMGAGAAPAVAGGSGGSSRADLDYLADRIVGGLSTLAEGAGAALDMRSNVARFATM